MIPLPEGTGITPATSRVQMAALGVLAATVIAGAFWTLHNYLPALAWACVFAIALWPLQERAAARLRLSRHHELLPLLFTLAIALVFIVPLVLLAVEVQREAGGIWKFVQEVRENGMAVPALIENLPLVGPKLAIWWNANLATPEDASHLTEMVNRGKLVVYGRNASVYLAHRAILLGFMLLALFFLFRDGETLSAQLRRGANRAFGPRGEAVGQQMIAAVRGTVNGLVLVGLGEGALIGIGYVVLGVPHPVLFGAVTAVAAMLPFCAAIPILIAALILFLKGSAVAAIVILVWGFATTFIADHAIRPVLIGGATRLPFLLVLLGILGGVESWGLIGLFVGPALMAASVSLWRDWVAPGARAVRNDA
jgi:predicted PurR-regulated permease PerM